MAIKFTTLLAGGVQTEEPVLSREDLKGLVNQLEEMLEACKKPVLEYNTVEEVN